MRNDQESDCPSPPESMPLVSTKQEVRSTTHAGRLTQHDPPVTTYIKDHIRSRGPITFAEFVEIALYHPAEGYYTRHRPAMGRAGDYLTAPETHPLFGALLGRQVIRLAELIGW